MFLSPVKLVLDKATIPCRLPEIVEIANEFLSNLSALRAIRFPSRHKWALKLLRSVVLFYVRANPTGGSGFPLVGTGGFLTRELY